MPRRSIPSAAERGSSAGVADPSDDLDPTHYTFNDTDLSIIRQRRASQSAGLRGAASVTCAFPENILGHDELPFPPG